jgi:DNA-binding SARP family transcriptional activator
MVRVVEFRVLGPVEAIVDGRPVPLPAAKPRALLAVLLLSRNRVVPVGELISELWGDEPPETATKGLQVYVSQLRKAIGADRVVTKPPGYFVHVEEGELDLDQFERLVREGRELLADDAASASEAFAQALGLWRGPALAEFATEPFARDAGARLEESRLAALEERIEADLALGRHARLVPELEELVGRHPLRERLRVQLMLALYRSGRQADALDLYRRTRETLIEELGIEPSSALQELERAILRHDRSLEAGRPASPVHESAAPAVPSRRLLAVAVVLVLAAAGAAAAVLVLSSGGSSGSGTAIGSSAKSDSELLTFVSKVENFLVQSRDGRREVSAAIAGVFDCRIAPRAAVVRLNRVQRNRQSLLQQVAALAVPNDRQAMRASDLLQKAAHSSIEADWHYRDLLLGRARCGAPGPSPELQAARAADANATRAKQAFLAVFNPLARRFDRQVWTSAEF